MPWSRSIRIISKSLSTSCTVSDDVGSSNTITSNYMRSPLQFHTSAAGKRTYFSSADPDLPSFPVSGIIPRLHFSFFPHRSSQGNLPGICQERDYPQHFSPDTGLTPDAPLQSHFQVQSFGPEKFTSFPSRYIVPSSF